jgi:tetratricopeptide (TPR) repeat protein
LVEPSDIDRLIELGLNRYGAGDLDGALLMWEEALSIDPDNAQANSYVDYVRLNYELLTAGEPSVEDVDAPFAIEEEPEYLIEIFPGRPSEPALPAEVTLPPAAALMSLDPLDAGWDIEETHDTSAVAPDASVAADSDGPAEPPPPAPRPFELELEPSRREPVNFEDATREYLDASQKGAAPAAPDRGFSTTEPTHGDFNSDDYTGGFAGAQATPAGFAVQETEIRKRDLGFVQPTSAASSKTSDLEATQERVPRYETMDNARRYETQDTGQRYEDASETSDDDLIDSLPTPRPAEPESGEIHLPPKAQTRDMPPMQRIPARPESSAHSQAEVMLSHATTRELSPSDMHARVLEPMLNAPTRELGLRPTKGMALDDDDTPTGQTDARAIRAAAVRDDGGASRPGTEGTRHDIVLPFDPIAAQSAQILDDVDASGAPGESHEETTRRRITRLLELAADWSEAGELEKAVSAVDLALSEDPNSALGQKLITRNKDTIMQLFQSYLGDLDRMPQLAKPLHELSNAPISPRAAFLLSRIDGTLTIDELLDVSGMPRLEAYRHLCQLFLRGILR